MRIFIPKYFPLEITVRVWDRYLIDQGRHSVFRIALGILSACESHASLLKLDFAGILQTLHKMPPSISDTALFRAMDTIPPLESVRGFVSSTGTRARRTSLAER